MRTGFFNARVLSDALWPPSKGRAVQGSVAMSPVTSRDSVFGVSGSDGGLEPASFAPGVATCFIVIDGSSACGCAAGTETIERRILHV